MYSIKAPQSREEGFEKLLDPWLKDMTEQGINPFYFLYFIPSGPGVPGQLALCNDSMKPGDRWELADPNPYRPAMNRGAMELRLRNIWSQLPVLTLPTEENLA